MHFHHSLKNSTNSFTKIFKFIHFCINIIFFLKRVHLSITPFSFIFFGTAPILPRTINFRIPAKMEKRSGLRFWRGNNWKFSPKKRRTFWKIHSVCHIYRSFYILCDTGKGNFCLHQENIDFWKCFFPNILFLTFRILFDVSDQCIRCYVFTFFFLWTRD